MDINTLEARLTEFARKSRQPQQAQGTSNQPGFPNSVGAPGMQVQPGQPTHNQVPVNQLGGGMMPPGQQPQQPQHQQHMGQGQGMGMGPGGPMTFVPNPGVSGFMGSDVNANQFRAPGMRNPGNPAMSSPVLQTDSGTGLQPQTQVPGMPGNPGYTAGNSSGPPLMPNGAPVLLRSSRDYGSMSSQQMLNVGDYKLQKGFVVHRLLLTSWESCLQSQGGVAGTKLHINGG